MPFKLRLIAVVTAVVGMVTASVAGCSIIDPHRDLTLSTIVNAEYDAPDVSTEPSDITDARCDGEPGCIEAVSTAEADYIRFDSRERAADYASSLDDGFVVHFIVMDFAGKDSASREHQRWAMEVLAGTWQDYRGEFPARDSPGR